MALKHVEFDYIAHLVRNRAVIILEAGKEIWSNPAYCQSHVALAAPRCLN